MAFSNDSGQHRLRQSQDVTYVRCFMLKYLGFRMLQSKARPIPNPAIDATPKIFTTCNCLGFSRGCSSNRSFGWSKLSSGATWRFQMRWPMRKAMGPSKWTKKLIRWFQHISPLCHWIQLMQGMIWMKQARDIVAVAICCNHNVTGTAADHNTMVTCLLRSHEFDGLRLLPCKERLRNWGNPVVAMITELVEGKCTGTPYIWWFKNCGKNL